MANQRGGNVREEGADGRLQPPLLLMPAKLTEVGSNSVSCVFDLQRVSFQSAA